MKRLLAVGAVLAITGGPQIPDRPQASAAEVRVVILEPVADSYVDASRPRRNFATRPLKTDTSPTRRSYLRFDLRGLAADVIGATLRLMPLGNNVKGVEVRRVRNNTWRETSINFQNPPSVGGRLAASGRATALTWLSIDVSEGVSGGRLLSLALLGRNSTALSLDSREGASPPRLVLRVATEEPPDPVTWGMFSVPDDPVPSELCGTFSRVQVMGVEVWWQSLEPADDAWSVTRFDAARQRIARIRAAGCRIVLNIGLHHAPDFVLDSPGGRFVNQYGTTHTASDEPNLILNDALRLEAQEYVDRVFQELGTDFYAVRVGGGHWGELQYPSVFNDGTGCVDTPVQEGPGRLCNYYWAFDANAQAGKEAAGIDPGWRPGDPSPNGEAALFLDWYLDKLTEFQNWQIAALRQAGYQGTAAVLYASWGMRDGDFEEAVGTNLAGTSSPEINGEVQRGYDHRRHVQGLTDVNVAKWGTWAEEPATLSWLASLNPADRTIPLMGENSGPGTADKSQSFVDGCRRNGAVLCAWVRWGEAHDDFLATIGG
jgi:hypothetical protein